ncbi:MAG: SAVED domain-containing protein [Clostridia bacterium]|nr:SAVED domain-containing protein [Clostridia bacterium]
MSKTCIPKNVAVELWGRAAGRCEFRGCNKPLYEHYLTKAKCNVSNLAHIIADSPHGPRGEQITSEELAKDPDNIMLVCPDCHKYIDHEGKDMNPPSVLRAMKKRHEDRVRRLTDLNEDIKAYIVTYTSPIGDAIPDLTFSQLQQTIVPEYYPAVDYCIELGGEDTVELDWQQMWAIREKDLVRKCQMRVLERMDSWDNKRIALFALAPMPLLVKLGTMLNRKHEVVVYQRRRTAEWTWPSEDAHVEFIINRPSDTSHEPVLVMSLSFSIIERISRLRPNASIWELTISSPSTDFLKARTMLDDFGNEVERLLDEISKAAVGQSLDVYMAVPVACAVEFGRAWMQKANMPLNLYDLDLRYSDEDKLALTINN